MNHKRLKLGSLVALALYLIGIVAVIITRSTWGAVICGLAWLYLVFAYVWSEKTERKPSDAEMRLVNEAIDKAGIGCVTREIYNEIMRYGKEEFCEEMGEEIVYCLNSGMGKQKALEHLLKICRKENEHD